MFESNKAIGHGTAPLCPAGCTWFQMQVVEHSLLLLQSAHVHLIPGSFWAPTSANVFQCPSVTSSPQKWTFQTWIGFVFATETCEPKGAFCDATNSYSFWISVCSALFQHGERTDQTACLCASCFNQRFAHWPSLAHALQPARVISAFFVFARMDFGCQKPNHACPGHDGRLRVLLKELWKL